MKKSLVAAMFAVMMISLVGCGKAPEPRTVEPTEVVEVVAPTEVVEATEAAEDEAEAETEVEEAVELVETEEPSSPYSYTDLSQTMYAQSTVNVRDLPEQTGAKLGSLSVNQEVTVTGQCNETGWYRISYNGGEGFVSDSYLGSEKVASQNNKSGSSQSTTKAPASNSTSETSAETTDDDGVIHEQVTPEDVAANADANTIHQDSYYCGFCDIEIADYNEYVTHMQAHGVQ